MPGELFRHIVKFLHQQKIGTLVCLWHHRMLPGTPYLLVRLVCFIFVMSFYFYIVWQIISGANPFEGLVCMGLNLALPMYRPMDWTKTLAHTSGWAWISAHQTKLELGAIPILVVVHVMDQKSLKSPKSLMNFSPLG